VSGGEPFQQPEALLDLLQRLDGSGLSRLVFTGYTLDELLSGDAILSRVDSGHVPEARRILDHIDLLICGRYVQAQHVGRGLLGSANQQIHFLTSRHNASDLQNLPSREIILHADGTLTLSGVA
jgi:anaerobic ribonucleoside-triphosphate reductase activating protein